MLAEIEERRAELDILAAASTRHAPWLIVHGAEDESVPVAEAHLTTPLNHRGFNSRDLASTPDILNMTFGVNTSFRHRAILSAAYVTPVTGPKPFNAEFVLQLNILFGKAARAPLPGFPTL